jgi:hypothetical protein
MIQKVVIRRSLRQPSSAREEVAYWLGKPLEERIATVDFLRNQYYGRAAGLQRVARVIQRPHR